MHRATKRTRTAKTKTKTKSPSPDTGDDGQKTRAPSETQAETCSVPSQRLRYPESLRKRRQGFGCRLNGLQYAHARQSNVTAPILSRGHRSSQIAADPLHQALSLALVLQSKLKPTARRHRWWLSGVACPKGRQAGRQAPHIPCTSFPLL